jgi:hypothetical protein
LSLSDAGLVEGSRRLLAGLTELAESLGRLQGLQERMAGSLRSLGSSFERARLETNRLITGLENLRAPTGGTEAAEKMEPN